VACGLLALVLLLDDGHHLAKHDSGVAVEEGNAGKALAVLERVDNKGLLGREDNL